MHPMGTLASSIFAGCLALLASGGGGHGVGAQEAAADRPGPGPVEVDAFHPDRQPDAGGVRPALPEPALGGEVTVHLVSRPRRLFSSLTGSGISRRILEELHESLLRTDYETWELVPSLAEAYWVEDQVILTQEAPAALLALARPLERRVPAEGAGRSAAADGGELERVHVLYGELEMDDDGWLLTPRSPGNPLEGPLFFSTSAVREVVRASAITFELRSGVLWHPSEGFPAHALDARDVLFSWGLFQNRGVDCDERRYQFLKVAEAEAVSDLCVRFFLARPDAWSLADLGEMCIAPSHLYDLTDPDHAEHDARADLEAQAAAINDNLHNRDWVGLGPYRLVEFGEQVLTAERFEGYFDPSRAGYLDRIRWRHVPGDAASLQALLEGELDYYDRLQAKDYFGAATTSEAFTARLYKGWSIQGNYAYVCWNTLSPGLDDVRVRRALSHALDVQKDVVDGWYQGLGNRVTGPFPFASPGYDHDIEPIPFDLERAQELLADAGWYDRDGDGWVDKDGEPLEIEYAAIASSEFTRFVGLLLQENLARIGVKFEVRDYEYGTFRERIQDRSVDAFCQAWVPPREPDPEQLWHSRWGQPGQRSANYAALRSERVDGLIDRGQGELDDERRWAIWRELHAELAREAPYLWLVNPATKFALSRRIRGFQGFHIDPGYSIRRWYLPAGTPGTRPADGVGHWAQGGGK